MWENVQPEVSEGKSSHGWRYLKVLAFLLNWHSPLLAIRLRLTRRRRCTPDSQQRCRHLHRSTIHSQHRKYISSQSASALVLPILLLRLLLALSFLPLSPCRSYGGQRGFEDSFCSFGALWQNVLWDQRSQCNQVKAILRELTDSPPPPTAPARRCHHLLQTMGDIWREPAGTTGGNVAKFFFHHGTICSLLAEDQWAPVPCGWRLRGVCVCGAGSHWMGMI